MHVHVRTHDILLHHQVVAVCWVLPAYGQRKVMSPSLTVPDYVADLGLLLVMT